MKNRSGLDAWSPSQWQEDAEDFNKKTEAAEWNSFNYIDPNQALFFQEFNPHDFKVPDAEKYVYNSKDPYDRPWRLSDKVKMKMYELHRHSPTVWHARTLAPLFKISAARADAILKLQALEWKYREMGFPLWGDNEELDSFWPEANSFWDQPHVPVLYNNAPVNFADEVEVYDIIERTKKRQDRLKNLADRLTDVEKEYHREMGAYGADIPERRTPEKLDNTEYHPSRFNWVMTDISDQANFNYSIAVRDRSGELREPDQHEFDIVRKREKRMQDPFYYVQYREHIDNLHGKYTTAKRRLAQGMTREQLVGVDSPMPDFGEEEYQEELLAEMD